MRIEAIDHLVVYAEDVESTSAFYEAVLDGERFEYGPGWWSVRLDGCQLNFRPAGEEFDLVSATPTPGAADVCLVSADPIASVAEALDEHGVEVVEGPVDRQGARGPMTSVYVHDPEGNLVEIAEYPPEDGGGTPEPR